MATIEKARSTSEIVKLAEVADSIKKAVNASSNMLKFCQHAAQQAAKQVDPAIGIMEAINNVTDAYSDDFGGDHNVRANFKDALFLQVAGNHPVSIEVRGKEMHGTASEFANKAKHTMKAASKAVRDDLGLGRAAGAGRKARAPSKAVSSTEQPEKLSASGLALIVGDRLKKDKDFLKELRAVLKQQGYKLTVG